MIAVKYTDQFGAMKGKVDLGYVVYYKELSEKPLEELRRQMHVLTANLKHGTAPASFAAALA